MPDYEAQPDPDDLDLDDPATDADGDESSDPDVVPGGD